MKTGLEGLVEECRANAAAWAMADRLAACPEGRCVADATRMRLERLSIFDALRRAGALPEHVAVALELRAAALAAGAGWRGPWAEAFDRVAADAHVRTAVSTLLDTVGATDLASRVATDADGVRALLGSVPQANGIPDELVLRYLLTRGTGLWPKEAFDPVSP